MPFFLITAQRRPLVEAGLLVGVVPTALSLVAPLAGWAFDRTGSRLLCTLALGSLAGGLALLSSSLTLDAGVGLPLVGLFLAGAGLGGFEAPNDGAVLGSLARERLGVGTATLGAMRNLGMTLGVAIAATLLDRGMARATGPVTARAVEGVRLALAAGAVMATAAAFAAAARPSTVSARTAAGAHRALT
jgi:MFS family permease